MPRWGKKGKEKSVAEGEPDGMSETAPNGSSTTGTGAAGAPPSQAPSRAKLVFHCQQAHGSPTGVISGFTNVKELYKKIAECYDFGPETILFCTLNTHKVDMTRLLGGQIGLDDFIFAHVKGRPKEVDVTKDEDALGLTITDNGAGYAFIKRIREGSIMSKVPGINVGDHIEKIDGKSVVGSRHFEVAKMLKEIPKASTFLLRVVEPMKTGFSNVSAASNRKSGGGLGTGKETLRLRTKGPATVGIPDDVVDVAIEKINGLLESFMGINDSELAQSLWEMGAEVDNPIKFSECVDNSEMADFGFPEDLIFDLWGAISDAKQGRLKKEDVQEFNENF